MQQRKSIFETNSSSSHSLVVCGGSDYADVTKSVAGKSKIELHEERVSALGDGTAEEVYDNDWISTAAFCLAWARNCGKPKHVAMLKKVIEDYTKVEVEFKDGQAYEDEDDEGDDEGRKERRKSETLDMSFVFRSEQALKDALFLTARAIYVDTTSY